MSETAAAWDQLPKGRLKVFLGYASGVGKSVRMLDEGRRRRERGQDVVVGALQPKIPPDVKPILEQLEIIPMVEVDGVPAMDVPAILRRHPQVCMVDGLAYDNPKGSRNAHRWQDVEELLAAGITVVGSVNLQYIDDQRKAVEKLTGKPVTQTIPRAFLNTADEIVIVDAPTESAPVTITALREMALLLSADVIDAGLQHYLEAKGTSVAWGTRERFLVILSIGANINRMINSARRSAARFHCDVLGVAVRGPRASDADRKAVEQVAADARNAGLRVDILESEEAVDAVVDYARSHGVTQIFAGHGADPNWRMRLFGSPINRLVRAAGGMDVRIFPQ
jgi:two-component system, OmpR family, sensor histidine kinase KdpD